MIAHDIWSDYWIVRFFVGLGLAIVLPFLLLVPVMIAWDVAGMGLASIVLLLVLIVPFLYSHHT